MPYRFQVAIDCARPHELADWWAETLGWSVEEQDEDFIRRMIAESYATDDDTMRHRGKLVWADGAAIRHPDAAAPDSPWSRVLFQVVPEAKTVKNRVHLDIRIGDDDPDAVVASLTKRGASELHRGQQGPHLWVTMADPEGNEFCVSE
jgi:Glyoxalase-like domain